ncbi:MAG: hypothetical protein JW908_14630 [Anaerolineales bacterium]|nr:hypothetical protein [Anaerolineales bacterium]
MAGFKDIANVWNNIKEIDLRPLRLDAQQGVRIALAGKAGSGRHTLADQMRRDPARLNVVAMTPVLLVDLDDPEAAIHKTANADLIILLINASQTNTAAERHIARRWVEENKNLLVVINEQPSSAIVDPGEQSLILEPWGTWGKHHVLTGDITDTNFISEQFSRRVIESLPSQWLSLGRYFPLFRIPIAKQLINDTCLSNAAYAVSTGIAEVVPVLDIPLNVADMFVLTKAQAFLVYKLGLVLGYSFEWQDYVKEFSGVLGGGFLWRQVARQLIGLVPAWGIVPKAAVSYSGTYVVGHVVLQWYLTGRHISRKQMQELYIQAFARGKNLAENLIKRLPKPKNKPKKQATKALPAPRKITKCPHCGKRPAKGAQFCHHCGQALFPTLPSQSDQEIIDPVE